MQFRRRTWFILGATLLVIGVGAWTVATVQRRLAGQSHEFVLADPPPFLTEDLALTTAREVMTRDGLDPVDWTVWARGGDIAPDGQRDQFVSRNSINPNRATVRFHDGAGRHRFVNVELDGETVGLHEQLGQVIHMDPPMSDAEATHMRLTKVRSRAYAELFDDKPDIVFPAHKLRTGDDDPFLIDVFVYSFEMEGRDEPVQAAVTNGMSDLLMVKGDEPDAPRRRELIQYFRDCTLDHAKRLRDMAWLPHFDKFHLDSHQTIAWEYPAVKGTPWKNALFLVPILRSHQEFTMEVEGDEVSFLWHIPISEAERKYRKKHGVDGLLDRMQEVDLPWVFDEDDRPPLVD